jgi:hypothetical protein
VILILVEHPVRELDIAKEIKNKLAYSGIYVEIVSINFNYTWLFNLSKYRIILFPSLQWKIINLLEPFFKGTILSLNYEQMLSDANKILKPINGSYLKLKTLHISWSEEYKQHLTNSGVFSNNIFVINKPSLELFNSLEVNKSITELKRNYNKQIFIPLTDLQAFKSNQYLSVEFKTVKLYELAVKRRDYVKRTLNIILKWLSEACIHFPTFLFILRPHPSISPKQYNTLLKELGIAKPINLIVTSDFNAIEWIRQSDIVLSNYSSLLNDSLEYEKKSFLLEPELFPDYLYYDWMKKFYKIKSLQSLISMLDSVEVQENTVINIDRFNGITELTSLIKMKYHIFSSDLSFNISKSKIINLMPLFIFTMKVFLKKIIFKLNKSLLRPGLVIDYFSDLK